MKVRVFAVSVMSLMVGVAAANAAVDPSRVFEYKVNECITAKVDEAAKALNLTAEEKASAEKLHQKTCTLDVEEAKDNCSTAAVELLKQNGWTIDPALVGEEAPDWHTTTRLSAAERICAALAFNQERLNDKAVQGIIQESYDVEMNKDLDNQKSKLAELKRK